MRISFVIPNNGMTGGTRVVAIYADRLARRGHDVTVVSGAHRYPDFRSKLKSLISGKGWPTRGPEPSYFNSGLVKIHELSSPRPVVESDMPDADVVVATWWETAEWVSRFSASKGAKAYLVQHHEVFPHLPVERSRATYLLPFQKIVISRWLADIMRNEYGDDGAVLIPNSVEIDQFFAPERGKQPVPTVGFVYSRVAFKGSDVILKAIDDMRAQLPGLRVVAFGAEHASPDIPLPEWIEYHFRPRQDRIRDLYSACDLWLCGSRAEGFYLPMLEAMACRCPVVSTRVGGPLDVIVDDVNGFLVDIDDSTRLAERSMTVLNLTDNDWRQMSMHAFSTATNYSWDDATDKMERTLRDLAQQPNHSQSPDTAA